VGEVSDQSWATQRGKQYAREQQNAVADLQSLRAENARLLAERDEAQREAARLRIEVSTLKLDRKPVKCPKCQKNTGIRYRELWTPGDPSARLKCRECGEWSTMAECGICAAPPREPADAPSAEPGGRA
jgi:hypothetical protein